MITLFVLFAHLSLDAAFGGALLSFRPHQRGWMESLFPSILVGVYIETLFVAVLMFAGIPLGGASFGTLAGMAILTILAIIRRRPHLPTFSVASPRWYEWALLATVGEKILFAAWQLIRTHTYFDDALTHWSGRARALFGGVNWSMNPTSPFFLGKNIGNNTYPLLVVIWRASSAKLSGEWNDVISRADGLVFFIVIVGTVWLAVWRFSKTRGLAAAAAFAVSAVPLHVWHAAAGYSDIAVEAFVISAVAALLRDEWLLAGVLAAGACWSKNDGLVLYFPALLVAAILLQWSDETRRLEWRNVGWFVLGFLTISPWLVFNFSHGLGVTAGQGQIAWHADAPGLLFSSVLNNTNSGPLWIAIFMGAIYSGLAMLKNRVGRALILAFLITLGGIVFTFALTSAYEFLANQETVHRVMMQFSSVAILMTTYGFWLKTRSVEKPKRVKKSGRKRAAAELA